MSVSEIAEALAGKLIAPPQTNMALFSFSSLYPWHIHLASRSRAKGDRQVGQIGDQAGR